MFFYVLLLVFGAIKAAGVCLDPAWQATADVTPD